MYNHHYNQYYYGNQVQDHVFADSVRVSQFVAPQLASPPLEQQEESLWYSQGNPHQQQISHGYNVLSSAFGHNEIASPQELVLFNLLQNQQQQNHQQMMHYHDNPLNQYDEQESSMVLHTNPKAALPLSPISMQSADAFDSSPILMGGSCFPHPMCSQSIAHHPQTQYYAHQLNSTLDMFPSQTSIKSDQSQEIAQMQHQYQQQQFYQTPEEQQPKSPKQRKKTTRKRASRSQLQCATCFKTFSRPYNLKSHQRTHTKERPFLCLYPDCGWTFARPHDLKRHELLHSGVKPFECVCGKRFARSDAYKRHQSVDITCSILTMPQQRKRKRRSDAIEN